MGWFNEDSDQAQAYDQVSNRPNEASWSHEIIAGAASYEAAKAYEGHFEKQGNSLSNAKAKEILGAAIGTFVDREVENHGLNFIDKEKAKQQGRTQVEEALKKYGGIDPKKIVSKNRFEDYTKKMLKEEEGYVVFDTPEEDQIIIEQLLEVSQGTLGNTTMKLAQGAERCVDCGRHYSFLDVVSSGLNVHAKQFMKNVMLGKYGYILNNRDNKEGPHACYKCKKPAGQFAMVYSSSTYGWNYSC